MCQDFFNQPYQNEQVEIHQSIATMLAGGICSAWYLAIFFTYMLAQYNVAQKTEESFIALVRAIDSVTMIYDLDCRCSLWVFVHI